MADKLDDRTQELIGLQIIAFINEGISVLESLCERIRDIRVISGISE